MKVSWAVSVTVENEFPQNNGVALATIKVEQCQDGDDEACDATWAARKTVEELTTRYSLTGIVHVKKIKVRETQ